jgi:hypothetical protein
MDRQTAHALDELVSRVDGLATEMKAGFSNVDRQLASLRSDVQTDFAKFRSEMRADVVTYRSEIKDEFERMRAVTAEALEMRWHRTQVLFEALRDDVQMLAGHVAELASRRPT